MSEKIKVEIFGIKDQPLSCGCGCGESCGPTKTMGLAYEEFVDFLKNSNIKDNVETQFIDVLMDNLNDHESVIKAMQSGFTLPLTAIDGELKFYGGISNEMIYDEIAKSI